MAQDPPPGSVRYRRIPSSSKARALIALLLLGLLAIAGKVTATNPTVGSAQAAPDITGRANLPAANPVNSTPMPAAPDTPRTVGSAALSALPLAFEPNVGQAAPASVRFV